MLFFAAPFLLWIVLPTLVFAGFCAYIEQQQRKFARLNPGQPFGLQQLRHQMSDLARAGWAALAGVLAVALLASCLHGGLR